MVPGRGPDPDNSAEPRALKELADLVRSALDSETSHRDRIDRRAVWIVTTTGGLATAVGVITAVIPKSGGFRLPWGRSSFSFLFLERWRSA
jgi:hypothetical protein